MEDKKPENKQKCLKNFHVSKFHDVTFIENKTANIFVQILLTWQ